MSDHTSALVPIRTWSYMSPELCRNGKPIDIGLFAEALIYYDRVLVALPDRWAFAPFISWFIEQGRYGDLITLLNDGTINLYYYSFFASAVEDKHGDFSIWSLQEDRAGAFPTFEADCLGTANLRHILPHTSQRAKLYKAIRGKVIEAKADDFGPAIRNARKDFRDPERCTLLVQAFLDEVYPMLGLRKPPVVESRFVEQPGKMRIGWNVNFEQIGQKLGKNIGFTRGTPLSAAARCNRLLWSAAQLGCDLYLHSPMSTLVGDKLYESSERLNCSKEIVEQLEAEVEFPDIRQLVNGGQIGLREVLELRQKGRRFREWLQDESDRDRNAIIAYHVEVLQESNWTRAGRKALGLFGILSSTAVATAIGGHIAGIPGAVVGTLAETGLLYVFDVASKLNEDWRPVVFGNWARDRISKKLLRARDR